MLQVLRLLLANQQGGTLAQMVASPHQAGLHKSLTGLVVHTVAVLLNMANTELLLPFVNMLTNPISLQVHLTVLKVSSYSTLMLQDAYLPTMQEDLLHEVRKAGGRGEFYRKHLHLSIVVCCESINCMCMYRMSTRPSIFCRRSEFNKCVCVCVCV